MRSPGLRLTPRDRRALGLGGALLLPLLAFSLVLRPYLGALSAAREELHAQRGLLVRERNLLAEAAFYPGLMDRAEALIQGEAPRLFGGTDELARTDALARYLGDQARRSRVQLQELRSLEPSPVDGGVLGLPLEMRAVGDLEGLLTFLAALEEGERLVRVERLTLEGGGTEELAGGPYDRVLSLSATVTGYGLRPLPAEGAARAGSGGRP